MPKSKQEPLFVLTERHIVSRPMIKSPGEVVRIELAATVWVDEGRLQISMQASSALTDELHEWRMPPVVTGREHHGRALADAWRRFQVMVQENTEPF